MTARHLAAMQAGRKRAQTQRHANAVARVRAFRAWLKAGSPVWSIPEIPSDADYRMVRNGR